jgi:hypothetical protein
MALTDLRAGGMDTMPIIAALGEICVKVAKSDPENAAIYLDSLTSILDATAQAIRGKAAMNMAQAIFGSRGND